MYQLKKPHCMQPNTINYDLMCRLQILRMIPTNTGARETSEATFLGVNKKAFFCLDTRMRDAPARRQTYSYSQNQAFSCGGEPCCCCCCWCWRACLCIAWFVFAGVWTLLCFCLAVCAATNADGNIVLGSEKGILRLYDGKTNAEGSFKRAKTQLTAFRDPILHVAVSRDGGWILGTQTLNPKGRKGFSRGRETSERLHPANPKTLKAPNPHNLQTLNPNSNCLCVCISNCGLLLQQPAAVICYCTPCDWAWVSELASCRLWGLWSPSPSSLNFVWKISANTIYKTAHSKRQSSTKKKRRSSQAQTTSSSFGTSCKPLQTP